jgi:CheY-like chemotaxis protein
MIRIKGVFYLESMTVYDEIRALIVEDDAHSLVAISALLRELGIQFKRNTTGSKVPEQVHGMTPPPDFILLDIDLLQGDAYSINQRLQADPDSREIPVIALSTSVDFATRQRAQRAGFAGLIVKPLPRRQFGELISRVLSGEHVWEAVS